MRNISNTLYIDKKLKYHSLVQAFSRTNRILNDSKPYGNIVDFRNQEKETEEAIELFSGKHGDQAAEIWLVEPAEKVIAKFEEEKQNLTNFMMSQGLSADPADVVNIKGDEARGIFVNLFKKLRRIKIQLESYTDLKPEEKTRIEEIMPEPQMRKFQGQYLETTKTLYEKQQNPEETLPPSIEQLDFEYVLFASVTIDYDYIMKLVAEYTNALPEKREMKREELIGFIRSDAKFIDESDYLDEYVENLPTNQKLDKDQVIKGYEIFKDKKQAGILFEIAKSHNLPTEALQEFIDKILKHRFFDDDDLTALLEPLGLGWKERTLKELDIMKELIPILRERANGKPIHGLESYDV